MPEPLRYRYAYPRPAVGVDAIVFRIVKGRLTVLLIKRGHPPFEGQWAFPGGFVNENERLADACRRELVEETGLNIQSLRPLPAFGDPGRDPRGWILSIPFYGFAPARRAKVAGGDDAAEASWIPIDQAVNLAFDHDAILAVARKQLAEDLFALPIARPLLPSPFDADALAKVYGALLGRAVAPAPLLRRLRAAKVVETVGQGFHWNAIKLEGM